MNIYDATLELNPSLPHWPGDPPFERKMIQTIANGDNCNVSQLIMTAHCGTHIDAPNHFIDGAATVDHIPLKTLIGRVYVVHFPQVRAISADMLRKVSLPPRTKRIFIKTDNSDLWKNGHKSFYKDFVALKEDAAEYLVEKNVILVGIDYLSIAPYDEPNPVHHILLSNGIVIVEGLDLSTVQSGRYALYCLPLNINGSDGAPARVILVGA